MRSLGWALMPNMTDILIKRGNWGIKRDLQTEKIPCEDEGRD